MKLDLVGGSYKDKYAAVNSRRVINWYIKKDLIEHEGSKYKKAYLPFPGSTSLVDTSTTYLRKIFVARTVSSVRCFVVGDQTLFEVDEAGVLTNRGTLTDIPIDNSTVFMEVNGNNELMIAAYDASYIFNLGTNVLTKITDSDFPSNVTHLSYASGYFFVCSGGRVYYSDLNDGLSWNGASVFTPIARADGTIATAIWQDNIYCFSSETIETYINDGSTPFSKQDRSTVGIGLVSVDTLCVTEQGMIFLGKTQKGQYQVYLYDGQICTPLAPLDLTWQLNSPATTSQTWDQLLTYTWENWFDLWDAAGIVEGLESYADLQYSKNGNVLYHLTIAPLHTTYVFDLITKEWTERQSYNPNSTSQQEFRGKWMVNFKGLNLHTDLYSGKILKEDYATVTEDSQTITRTIISQIISNEKKSISIYEFELETSPGVGLLVTPSTAATLSLYVSKDSGNTYGSAITVSAGASGEYTTRSRITKLGTARDWVFKIVQTSQADIAIQEAIIHGVVDNY